MTKKLLLLAEDEPLVRFALEEALEEGGYTVLSAPHGSMASALLEERHAELAGFITDIRLGEGPDGWELGRLARQLNPAIAVVYITGDSAEHWTAHGVPKSLMLQKPFAEAQVVTAISTLLNEANPSTSVS